MLENRVSPREFGLSLGKNWRSMVNMVGMSAIDWRGERVALLYHGSIRALVSSSQILVRIFARVSMRDLRAPSGSEAGTVSLNSNRCSWGGRRLLRGGVGERWRVSVSAGVLLVIVGSVPVWEGVTSFSVASGSSLSVPFVFQESSRVFWFFLRFDLPGVAGGSGVLLAFLLLILGVFLVSRRIFYRGISIVATSGVCLRRLEIFSRASRESLIAMHKANCQYSLVSTVALVALPLCR